MQTLNINQFENTKNKKAYSINFKPLDPASWILLGACLTLANPGFGSGRSVILFLGCLMISIGTIWTLASSPSAWLAIGRVFIIVVAVETIIYFNQPNSFDPFPLLLRIICYLHVSGGVACGLAMRRSKGVDMAIAIAILPLVIGLSSVRYLLADGGAALQGVGRIVLSDEFSPVGICFNYGILATLMFVILATDLRWFVKLTSAFALIMAGAVMLSTGTRGGILSFMFSTGLYIFSILAKGKTKKKLTVLLIVGLSFALFGQLIFLFGLGEQFQYIISRFEGLDPSVIDESILQRQYIREFYFKTIDNWWFTGFYGYAGNYPHNVFLELWIRFGIFGLCLAFGLFFLTLKLLKFIFIASANASVMIFAVPTIFNLFNAQTSLSLEFNRWLLLGVGFMITIPTFYVSNSTLFFKFKSSQPR
jgi:hypothetical protein